MKRIEMKNDNNTGNAHFGKWCRLLFRNAFLTGAILLGTGSAMAQWTDSSTGVTFTPISGTAAATGTNKDDANEGYAKACDGRTDTKYCTSTVPNHVVLQASEPVNLTGYTITTANDNATSQNRNPLSWTIEGSNDNSTWTTLVTVTNDNVLQDVNYTQYNYSCTTTGYYSYFRFTVTAHRNNWAYNHMQYSEFHPIGAVKTYVNPTGISADDMSLAVGEQAAVNCTITPDNGKRDITYTSDNTSVATVNDQGQVTGVAAGTAHITLQTHNLDNSNGPSTTITVTVLNSENVGYVFTYQNAHFLGGTTNNTDITTFNPGTCLWTGTSGGTWRNSAGWYLNLGNSRVQTESSDRTMTLVGSENGESGMHIRRGNSTYYYLTYNKGWSNSGRSDTDSGTDVLFAVRKVTYSAVETAPSISGDSQISMTGSNTSFRMTASAQYTPGYFDYIFYNGAHHYCLTESSNATTTAPAASSFTYTWSLDGIGTQYATINASTGAINYIDYPDNDVVATVKLTATSTGKTFEVTQPVTFIARTANPTTISGTPATVYVGQQATVSYTLSATGSDPIYNYVQATSANTGMFTVSSSNPHRTGTVTVTGVAVGTANLNLQAKNKPGTSDACNTSVQITVKDKVATPVITITPNTDIIAGTAIATITCATSGARIYYTIDGSTPTTESILYDLPQILHDQDVIKAIAVLPDNQYYDDSDVAFEQYTRCVSALPAININGNSVTFSSPEDGATFYYTTDGSEPTTSSSQWNGSSFTPANETTIKVIAKHGDCQPSAVVSRTFFVSSGVSGSTVYLNDLEDHNWSYYKGEETTIGNTAQTYKDKYRYTLYSPDPRNVKITYNCGSVNGSSVAIKVSPTESENQFVYYKTVEKYVIGFFTDDNGNGLPDETANTNEQYAYTVISNPFSVRPKAGSTYYGFAGWKIVSGAEHIGRGASRTQATNGTVLSLDEIVHFINLDNGYTPNCISAEIVLEATWTAATVWSGNAAHTFTGGTYETNFIVASGNIADITQNSPCTILGMYPDGTSNNSTTRTITGLTVGASTVKVEYIRHGNGTFNANGKNLIMGRGITSSTGAAQGNVYGRNTAGIDCVNTVKVESGYYSRISNIGNNTATASNLINNYTILGCDYDRALANYYVAASEIESNAYNIKLRATRIYGTNGSNPQLNRSNGQLYLRTLFKSGVFASEPSQEYYFHSYYHRGQRYLEMEGGYNKGHIKGGSEVDEPQIGSRSLTVRMRGGRIDGQVGMGSTSNNCYGERVAAITGGRIGGWIAPGSNCSTSGSGTAITEGESYIYFGGTAEINSRQFGITSPELIGGQSTGGVIYGAGLGSSKTSARGQMNGGSNIVLADQAYCERGIYGGGALAQTKATANIFILGGRVGTGMGRIKDVTENVEIDVEAGVFGGACDVGGDTSFIYMSGGVVESGIYGGSNIDGTMTGNTLLRIVGGQVGTSSALANVHGGGYGQSTKVNGNVEVNIGIKNGNDVTYTASGDAVIYGDVYGGSALGTVNAGSSNTTTVTLSAGTINGALYGGGLGNNSTAANVNGAVAVKVYGGTVNQTSADGSGGVYGANNINGAPQSTVTVDIYGTDPAPAQDQYGLYSVYGGGNKADYGGTPVVTVHNCDNSIEYVYGGGNAAAVNGTNVTINGGNVIGNVFGGGNGTVSAANVNGNASTTIHGGTILNVFGGSNTNGAISGTVSVTVDDNNSCTMNLGDVYGGGNVAPYSGTPSVTINSGTIANVYGGGNAADVSGTSVTINGGNITGMLFGGGHGDKDSTPQKKADVNGNVLVSITGGTINKVFGGSNSKGSITGSISIDIEKDDSSQAMHISEVYGGGNFAAGNAGTITIGCTGGADEGIGDVYGGANAADITSDITLNITGGRIGRIFGGNNTSGSISGNIEVNVDIDNSCNQNNIGSVYGGGNQAAYTAPGNASPAVNIINGTISDNVFGGGLGSTAVVTGNPIVTIGTWSGTDVVNIGGSVFGGGDAAAVDGNVSVIINSCGNTIGQDLYGGGNAAPVHSTNTTMWGGLVMGNVFGGGNGSAANTHANVGYRSDDTTPVASGDAVMNIYGGTIGTWTDGVCADGTGGIFGGSNTRGDISGEIRLTIDKQAYGNDDTNLCSMKVKEVYGAGNRAAYGGNGITFILGCVDGIDEVYGGAKQADINEDINLTISSGTFKKVFGGNNISGNITGSITVNIEETGCQPTVINELYGCGNQAAYTTPTGKADPTVNVNSCTRIDYVYGGGYGAGAKVTGSPVVNIKEEKGLYANLIGDQFGAIGNVFGGGNEAVVDGSPTINVGTVAGRGARITGNVFGGGNNAAVTGKTNVAIGKEQVNP